MTGTCDRLLASDALIAWRAKIAQLVEEWRSDHVDLSDSALSQSHDNDLVSSR